MTIQGAIAELQYLREADDVPFYYKGGIEKVIKTIDDYIGGGDDYVKRRADRKTEPQKKCHRDEEYACHLYPNEGACNNCKLWYEDEPQTDCSWK